MLLSVLLNLGHTEAEHIKQLPTSSSSKKKIDFQSVFPLTVNSEKAKISAASPS